MLSSSPNTQQSNTAPLCVCLQYVGDNGPCPVHGKAPAPQPVVYTDDFRLAFALAQKRMMDGV
jgi:hypothetical protein